ncbi:hypothetical protein QR680_011050 [Steinernema hermaphroditum]|uniref:Uncharacterized protein n=1 Tax=Steinernema hermaphroditum TaxID=289476 RepID=A0AA39ISC7_9BILA|nr:hypothetical protein QR680_011050 [Steinernema hermaphroditum]
MNAETAAGGDSPRVIEVTVVGDTGVGKSSLIYAYALDVHPWHVPNEVDQFLTEVEIDEKVHGLQISFVTDDVQDIEYGPSADVFIVCFSVANPHTLRSAKKDWIPTIRQYFPTTPIFLVGMKADLRTSYIHQKWLYMSVNGYQPVTKQKAKKVAKRFSNVKYVDCCSTRGQDVREVFKRVAKSALNRRADETMCPRSICTIM